MPNHTLHAIAQQLVEVGRYCHSRGWVPATSGNFSARLDADRVAVTCSGRHKGQLALDDIIEVDLEGRALASGRRPSDETALHTSLYRRDPGIAAVLHVHGMHGVVLSRLSGEQVTLQGWEVLKALRDIGSHEAQCHIPVFPNSQDIPTLARQVEAALATGRGRHGYLIAGHGLYCWGTSIAEALRHAEALEYLFECELLMKRAAP
jgi:methylthioribulose-1-phosphate dehydratase